jgi:3-hydroxyisobutyrate dehydrogenase-like beta-hydroxyacid dehydrogenase
MSALPRIFFIGVGNMGNPMAANLLKAGYALTVHDISPDKAQNLVAQGAVWADSIATVCLNADVVMASLPGPPQVREVMLGEQGVLAHAKRGATIIDTSTSAVELVQELVVLAHHKGLGFLEAPVTNAVDMAALGRLSIFVGGEHTLFEQHKALFEVIGEKIFHVGAPGNGATIKLLTNLLWFVSAAAIGEGLMLGAKAGIPLHTVWEAIKSSAGNVGALPLRDLAARIEELAMGRRGETLPAELIELETSYVQAQAQLQECRKKLEACKEGRDL